MIFGTRRKDPMQAGDARTAICGFQRPLSDTVLKERGYFPLLRSTDRDRAEDHSVNCARDLLFLTDSSRFIHREDPEALSVNDPGREKARVPSHIGKIND